jgi:hypothetical protein
MSKSTPLSQLPNSVGNDGMIDNDPAVQEVLSELAQGSPNDGGQQSYMPQMPQQQMYNGSPHVANLQDYMNPKPNFNTFAQNYGLAPQKNSMGFDSDFKIYLLVVAIVFVVQVVPVEQFVFKYVAIDKVPYSPMLIKAAVGGFLFYAGRRYLL